LNKATVMENDTNVLPENFTGVFYFTNDSDEDFTSKWNGVEYTFPAGKQVPLIIPGETPEGVQSIRKKFAREFGEREFYKTEKGKYMNSKDAGSKPALYTDADIAPFIQKCLVPLEPGNASVRIVKENNEAVFTTDQKGKPRTRVLEDGDSLTGEGTVIG
jgi:hypothetical protein